jgi:hypothetical protein
MPVVTCHFRVTFLSILTPLDGSSFWKAWQPSIIALVGGRNSTEIRCSFSTLRRYRLPGNRSACYGEASAKQHNQSKTKDECLRDVGSNRRRRLRIPGRGIEAAKFGYIRFKLVNSVGIRVQAVERLSQ